MKICILNTGGAQINGTLVVDEQELAKILFERSVTYNEQNYEVLSYKFDGHYVLLQTDAPVSELDMFPLGETKLSYNSKHMYIDDDGVMRYVLSLNNKPARPGMVEKQPYILPGVYDGLWSAYYVVIIFANGNKSEPINDRWRSRHQLLSKSNCYE
jgi:hypothetical protein